MACARKRESASLVVSLVRINVDSISTHLHASIRLTLRCLFANSLDKLYRSFGLCVPFARREGNQNRDPLLQGSSGEKLSRSRCIDIVDTRPEVMRGCCYNVSTGVTAL